MSFSSGHLRDEAQALLLSIGHRSIVPIKHLDLLLQAEIVVLDEITTTTLLTLHRGDQHHLRDCSHSISIHGALHECAYGAVPNGTCHISAVLSSRPSLRDVLLTQLQSGE